MSALRSRSGIEDADRFPIVLVLLYELQMVLVRLIRIMSRTAFQNHNQAYVELLVVHRAIQFLICLLYTSPSPRDRG